MKRVKVLIGDEERVGALDEKTGVVKIASSLKKVLGKVFKRGQYKLVGDASIEEHEAVSIGQIKTK